MLTGDKVLLCSCQVRYTTISFRFQVYKLPTNYMLVILPVCISRVYISQEKYPCWRTHKTRAVGFESFVLPCQFIHNSPPALRLLILSMFPSIANFTPKPRRHQRIFHWATGKDDKNTGPPKEVYWRQICAGVRWRFGGLTNAADSKITPVKREARSKFRKRRVTCIRETRAPARGQPHN